MRRPKAEFIVDNAMRREQPYLWQRPKNGVYYVIHYTDPPGRIKKMESLKTKDLSTAQDKLYIWKQQRLLEQQAGIRHVGLPLEDAIREYLRHHEKRYKPVSTRRYRNAFDNVLSFLGNEFPLGSLQARDLQDYQLDRVVYAEKTTVDFELGVMRAFLNWCKRRAWVHANVADHEHIERLVSGKKPSKKAKRIFTDEELKILLTPNNLYWQYYYAFYFLYFTGCRIGELSHLRAKDVSLRKLEIRIQEKTLKIPLWNPRQRKVIASEVHWTPKWYEERTVPIEDRLAPVLREFHERRVDNIFGIYFLGPRGTLITDHISRQIKQLTGKNDISVHTFRHTHISHALNRWGRHATVVQKWVGHKHLKTTEGYVHVGIDDLHREAKKTGK
ncbi:site-specific integrase [Acidobacteria bacterium AH-259-A15]|nr:site-specific integrase [Acidobacteria bacterium AH-259-A15]